MVLTVGLARKRENQHHQKDRDLVYLMKVVSNSLIFYERISKNYTYNKLFNHPVFEERVNYTQLDINQVRITDPDHCDIIDSSLGAIFTSLKGTSLAICLKSKDRDGKSFITLCNVSSPGSLEKRIIFLRDKMVDEWNCFPESIKFFILGGKIVDRLGENSLMEMYQTLLLAKKYNIVGARFNNSFDLDGEFQVLMTANKIYYSTKSLFQFSSTTIYFDWIPPQLTKKK
jgi:hypothetical protein